MDEEGQAKKRSGQKWFQDWRWIASIAGAVLAISFLMFTIQLLVNSGKADKRDTTTAEISKQTTDIRKIVRRLDKNQEGIDELVRFVHDVESRPEVNTQVFIDLLCASEDPVRVEACRQLTPK